MFLSNKVSVLFWSVQATTLAVNENTEFQGGGSEFGRDQETTTVVPVMNGHPRDQAKVSVHCRWPLVTGTGGQALGRQI